ncbi:integrase catalytic domain-containing protein [Trichonephila clavipes]|nr:integrase catalytic domain-containing protein [Trichonephila clavipes]
MRRWKYTGDDDPEQVTSVQGYIWNRKEDELKINLNWIETYKLEIVSKRAILSVIHGVFDPIVFLCSVLLIPKLMFQKMWKDNNPQFAYPAPVFAHIEYSGVAHANLLVAKSRIAPVKTVTIPRLELLAATRGIQNAFIRAQYLSASSTERASPARYKQEYLSCQVIYSQFGLAIHPNDHQARRRFVEWAENEIAVVPDFHKRILFSDEAHFWLNCYVNKQNWSEANLQVHVETPLHPEKLIVWCALWAGGIIGPYFFKNDEGHNELWFQQDGATCHTARATIDLLKDTFGDRLISRFGPVNWPPRSCDLTPLDYFLWGYVKSLVYADKPQTLEHLEDNIRHVIADIRPQMLEKVIENWTSRLDYIRASRGSPIPEIIFKM